MPDATMLAVINGNYIGEPEFTACSVEITNSGALYVSAGETYTAVNDFVNNGEVYIEDTGSFLQTRDDATVSGSGTFTAEKKTTPYHEYDYTYLSSPSVTATTTDAFVTSGGSNANYIWNLNTTSFNDTAPVDGLDDEGDDWVGISGTLVPGVGYAVLGAAADFPFDPNNMSSNNQDTIEFDGAFNTGTINLMLVADADAGDGFSNQNLIGNPYPSAIDINAFYNANSSVLGANFYFWTHNTAIASGGGGTEAYNFTNDDYSQWIASGAGAGGVASASGGNAPTQFVASAQGFLAEAENPGAVTFTNSMRIAGNNTNFLSPITTNKNRFWLNMRGDNGDFRQILIGFFDEATDHFDPLFDGPRMENGNNTDFYSVLTDNNRHFAIQGLHTFNTDKTIPLGIEIVQEGNYSIEIDHTEGLFSQGQAIYLVDHFTNTTHNLSNIGHYTFFTVVGNAINDRFEIRFTDNTTDLDELFLSSVAVYPNPSVGIFNISWRGDTKAQIQVSDVSGKIILLQKEIESENRSYEMNLTNLVSGVYFVKLSVNDKQVIKKIILK